ncbi:MAG: aminoglycoside phosphotransferase family protein [Lachnospiraceae bacterium]|nr:aminoglycoside phosphotransferase family protein [Lachnospiraceae bacterium]
MFNQLLNTQYGLHIKSMKKSSVGAGSDTWFVYCEEGDFVLKYPAVSEINHPELEPELCAFLNKHGIPVCSFLQNYSGGYLSKDSQGCQFTVQKLIQGSTPEWNTATDAILQESAELLGKIHSVLKDYPGLSVGIGENFFRYMTPQKAAESYHRSLEIARNRNDRQIEKDLEWRLSLMEHFPNMSFDLSRLTLRNTHGDFFISQFICEQGHLKAVIDWTTACIHPVIWEIMRSYVYGSPKCVDGEIDTEELRRYIQVYCRYGTINEYDLKNLISLFYYQIAVCDYYGQYYSSTADNRDIYLKQAVFSTKMLKGMKKNLMDNIL